MIASRALPASVTGAYRPTLHAELRPPLHPLRACASAILKEWLAADFQPAACRDALVRLAVDLPRSYFDLDAFERGGRPATDEALFDLRDSEPWLFRLTAPERDVAIELELGCDEEIALAGAIVRAIGACQRDLEGLRALVSDLGDDPLADLVVRAAAPDARFGVWPASPRAGLYRREHASLVFRSGSTVLVLDPQRLSDGWTTRGALPYEASDVRADAVLVTHGHEDHWHLPSILSWIDVDSPVLVPHVPRGNLLASNDMLGCLRRTGQRALAPPWGSSVVVGDVRIDVLPFYGEQPTRGAPGPDPALRNWGNCYRLSAPEFSAIVLVDSGTDPRGDVVDAVRASIETHGPVDLVLSCCFEFPEAINIGLPEYVLTLPFDRLRAIHAERAAERKLWMTAGPEGVARACVVAGASHFLPYAHGFDGLGATPAGEAEASARVARHLALARATTKVHAWRPGDAFVLDGEAPRVARAGG